MTNQELFDECVGHVLRQGKPAISSGSPFCYYQTAQGNCCAVGGPLVKRGLYREEMEFNVITSGLFTKSDLCLDEGEILLRDALTAWGVKPDQIPLLKQIQVAHDEAAKSEPGQDVADDVFITVFKGKAHLVSIAFELNTLVFDTFNQGEPAC